jgi:flagellin
MFSGTSLLNNEARTDAATAAAPTSEKFSIQVSNNTSDTISLKAGGFLNIGGFSGAASVVATKVTGGTSATGQAVLTLPNITGLAVGMSVTGANVPTGAVITALTSATSVTLSDNITTQVANDAVITFGNSTSTTRSTVLQLASGSNPPQSVVGTTVYKVNSSMVYTKIGTVTGVSGNNITLGTTSAAVTWADADEIVFSGQLTQVHSGTSTDKTLHQAVRQLDSSDATKYQMAQRAAEGYVKALTTQRSLLGAYQNQIEYTVSNVTELSANLDAARSNVQDTDYASETATLTKGQILQQAATAMLAQANQMPNVILSLLK